MTIKREDLEIRVKYYTVDRAWTAFAIGDPSEGHGKTPELAVSNLIKQLIDEGELDAD